MKIPMTLMGLNPGADSGEDRNASEERMHSRYGGYGHGDGYEHRVRRVAPDPGDDQTEHVEDEGYGPGHFPESVDDLHGNLLQGFIENSEAVEERD
jgi:hypothetical protein